MTLFIITLPAIGLAERYGLQEQSARFIRRISAATVGRLLITYQLFRVLMGILGIRLLGHPAFVRPLVFPMALGAAEAEARVKSVESLPAEEVEKIKAGTAASENYGNFYGQNLSPVQSGILLVYGVLGGLGYAVSVWSIVLYAIPIATLSVVVARGAVPALRPRLRRRSRTRAEGGRLMPSADDHRERTLQPRRGLRPDGPRALGLRGAQLPRPAHAATRSSGSSSAPSSRSAASCRTG